MLELVESHFGLSQSSLQIIILTVLGIMILGSIWRQVVAGIAMIFVLTVFFHHPGSEVSHTETVAKVEDPKHREFMQDCMTIAANEEADCEEIWNDNEMARDEAAETEKLAHEDQM